MTHADVAPAAIAVAVAEPVVVAVAGSAAARRARWRALGRTARVLVEARPVEEVAAAVEVPAEDEAERAVERQLVVEDVPAWMWEESGTTTGLRRQRRKGRMWGRRWLGERVSP